MAKRIAAVALVDAVVHGRMPIYRVAEVATAVPPVAATDEMESPSKDAGENPEREHDNVDEGVCQPRERSALSTMTACFEKA